MHALVTEGNASSNRVVDVVVLMMVPLLLVVILFNKAVEAWVKYSSGETYKATTTLASIKYLNDTPLVGWVLFIGSIAVTYFTLFWVIPKIGKRVWGWIRAAISRKYGYPTSLIDYKVNRWDIAVRGVIGVALMSVIILPIYMVVYTIKKPHNGVLEGLKLFRQEIKNTWNLKGVTTDSLEDYERREKERGTH